MTAPGRGPAPAGQAAGDGAGGQVGQEGQGQLVGLEPPPGRLGHVPAVVPGVVQPQRRQGPDRDRPRHPGHPGPPALSVEGGQVPAEGVGGRLPVLQPVLRALAAVRRPPRRPSTRPASPRAPTRLWWWPGRPGRRRPGGRPRRQPTRPGWRARRCPSRPGRGRPAAGRPGRAWSRRPRPGRRWSARWVVLPSSAAETPQTPARMASSTAELNQARSPDTMPRTANSAAARPNPIAPALARDRVSRRNLNGLRAPSQPRRRAGAGGRLRNGRPPPRRPPAPAPANVVPCARPPSADSEPPTSYPGADRLRPCESWSRRTSSRAA